MSCTLKYTELYQLPMTPYSYLCNMGTILKRVFGLLMCLLWDTVQPCKPLYKGIVWLLVYDEMIVLRSFKKF